MGWGLLTLWYYHTRSKSKPIETRDTATNRKDALEKTPSSKPDHIYQRMGEVEIGSPIPSHQAALVLKELRSKFTLIHDHLIPATEASHELLIKVHAIGLNPIDWKGPDYNFGIPVLPFVAGRDLVGVVVTAPSSGTSHIKPGDLVVTASTDYRDLRKAAFQHFAVATDSTVFRLPRHLNRVEAASLGVAAVSAALALGVCLGVDFSRIRGSAKGPHLLDILHSVPPERIPTDVQDECLRGVGREEGASPNDWIVVWGGSTTSALLVAQLAKLSRCRVALVVDVAKHGARLSQRGVADLLVDSADRSRAIQIIRSIAGGRLRYAMDTTGRESATILLEALKPDPSEVDDSSLPRAHLVGFTGVPKAQTPGVVYHAVPLKVFHELPEIGSAVTRWLENLLLQDLLQLPEVTIIDGGLAAVNDSLDKMRKGEVSGKRLVIKIDS